MSTLHRIIHSAHISEKNAYLRGGQKASISPEVKRSLIETATACARNRRLPYTEVAKLAGVTASATCLRRVFESEGYHRRIARIKPFLSPEAKVNRVQWAQAWRDWGVDEWADVIF